MAANERPPVCKILDFGKFRYQQSHKRAKKTKAHQQKLKEIRLRPKTGEHDVETKIHQARKFLEHKDKVLIYVMYKGRELQHIEEGRRIIQYVLEKLLEVAKVEKSPGMEGSCMTAMLAPQMRVNNRGQALCEAPGAKGRRGVRQGDRPLLCEAPSGPVRQKGSVPLSRTLRAVPAKASVPFSHLSSRSGKKGAMSPFLNRGLRGKPTGEESVGFFLFAPLLTGISFLKCPSICKGQKHAEDEDS